MKRFFLVTLFFLISWAKRLSKKMRQLLLWLYSSSQVNLLKTLRIIVEVLRVGKVLMRNFFHNNTNFIFFQGCF